MGVRLMYLGYSADVCFALVLFYKQYSQESLALS